jgi:hypothetical protein
MAANDADRGSTQPTIALPAYPSVHKAVTQACGRSAAMDASRSPPVRTLLMMSLVFDLRGSGQCWLINAAAISGAGK